jgi:hypothetical protein
MRTRVDGVLRDEARRFALRFACEDCVHWNVTAVVAAGAAAGACGNGWPEGVERDALAGDEVVFCKEFELGSGD